MWPSRSLLWLSRHIAAHVATHESPVTMQTYCGPCGHPICDDHTGCNVYRGREQIPVRPYESHCVTTRYHGPCGPLSWECGHIGHNKYRYVHETLRWPHGIQWALIFAWASWMTTRAATGVWNCTSLLHGHMGHSCYKIGMKNAMTTRAGLCKEGDPCMATWAAVCMTVRYHIIPLHSDGPWGPLSKATVDIDSFMRLSGGHMGYGKCWYSHEHLRWPHGPQQV